ncbi:MAG: hypothetical protein PHX09_03070 [Clostridia bacterium]|nr:hypothetical protein [Clostridia bacterium]MDD4685753.1 hypothetical protein [Clostridia bacterium]
MKFKDRIKSYKFWVALSASIVILLQALGEAFNFSVSESIINGITLGFCGVLVVLGVIEKPVYEDQNDITEDIKKDINEIKEDINEINKKENTKKTSTVKKIIKESDTANEIK